jgi:hypothetical protein
MNPRFSSAFRPQTDGQTERANRVVEEVLRHFIDGSHANWEELLPLVAFAMNNARNETGETAHFLTFARHPVTPVTLALPRGQLPTLERVFSDLDETLEKVRALLLSAQDRQKAYADKFRIDHAFSEGMSVLLSTRNF